MKDERKTKRELIRELRELRRQIKGLEGSGFAPTWGEKAQGDEEALRIQADRLEHLQKISRSILAATSTDEIMQTALEELRTIVPCHRATIARIDTEAQLAHVLAVDVNGETQCPPGSSIPLEAFGMSDTLLQGEVEIIKDIDTLDPTSPRVGPPRAEGVRSYIRLPMIVQGELLGTLDLRATEPRAFDREHCDIAREVTDMLSVALQQASLFESAQQRTLELNRSNALISLLGKVAARLHSNLSAEQLLGTLGDELRKIDLTSLVALFKPSSQAAHIRYFSIKPLVLSKVEKSVGFSHRASRLNPSRHPIYLDLQENRQARFVLNTLEVLQKKLARQALKLADASPDTPSIFLPLVTEERFAGVLTVWGEDLREDDIPAFQILTNQVAIALENAHLFEQVRTSRERLQFLARRQVKVQENERQHVARELHDEIGQMLTGMRLTLERCRQLPPEEANAKLREAEELTRELISRLREISLSLHPSMLDDLGLVPALIWQFDHFTTQTGVRVDFEHSGMEGRLPSDLETAAYRITQEALTNVARHTGADEVTVQIGEEGSRLSLRIEDKGPGFNPETLMDARHRVGLTGMHERAVALGGRLAIRSSPGEGTRILAELPLHERLERRSSVRVT